MATPAELQDAQQTFNQHWPQIQAAKALDGGDWEGVYYGITGKKWPGGYGVTINPDGSGGTVAKDPSKLKKIANVAIPLGAMAAAPFTGGSTLALMGLGAGAGAAVGGINDGWKGALLGGGIGAGAGLAGGLLGAGGGSGAAAGGAEAGADAGAGVGAGAAGSGVGIGETGATLGLSPDLATTLGSFEPVTSTVVGTSGAPSLLGSIVDNLKKPGTLGQLSQVLGKTGQAITNNRGAANAEHNLRDQLMLRAMDANRSMRNDALKQVYASDYANNWKPVQRPNGVPTISYTNGPGPQYKQALNSMVPGDLAALAQPPTSRSADGTPWAPQQPKGAGILEKALGIGAAGTGIWDILRGGGQQQSPFSLQNILMSL